MRIGSITTPTTAATSRDTRASWSTGRSSRRSCSTCAFATTGRSGGSHTGRRPPVPADPFTTNGAESRRRDRRLWAAGHDGRDRDGSRGRDRRDSATDSIPAVAPAGARGPALLRDPRTMNDRAQVAGICRTLPASAALSTMVERLESTHRSPSRSPPGRGSAARARDPAPRSSQRPPPRPCPQSRGAARSFCCWGPREPARARSSTRSPVAR